jgi:hypothetical protein
MLCLCFSVSHSISFMEHLGLATAVPPDKSAVFTTISSILTSATRQLFPGIGKTDHDRSLSGVRSGIHRVSHLDRSGGSNLPTELYGEDGKLLAPDPWLRRC